MNAENQEFKEIQSFENTLTARISENQSRYEFLAASLLKNDSVTWELKGNFARLEIAQGRVAGSIKPSHDSNYTEPLTTAPLSLNVSEAIPEIIEMMAWLESEIITNY